MQNQSLNSESILLHNDDVYVGDWCIFEVNKNLRIGLVLSFSYLTGTTLKSKEYSRPFAPVSIPAQATNVKGIGVLCSWYNWDSHGTLTCTTELNHNFLKIEYYRGTIKKPSYTCQNLSLSYDLVTILDSMQGMKKSINISSRLEHNAYYLNS